MWRSGLWSAGRRAFGPGRIGLNKWGDIRVTGSGSSLSASGLAAAVRDLAFADDAGEIGQGSLFGAMPPDPDGVGELAEAGPGERRGRGRPVGSRNRSTQDWSRFILSRYRSPLIGLAEIASATPAELQAALGGPPRPPVAEGAGAEGDGGGGISLQACLSLIMQAQASLAPYLHQKQPLAIDAGGVGMMTIIIQKGEAAISEGVRIVPIDDAEEVEENQGLAISGGAMSE